MNIFLKTLGLGMVCLMLAACGKSNEEKVLSQAQNNASAFDMAMPDCALRDVKTRLYLNGRGCTKAEEEAFRKQRVW